MEVQLVTHEKKLELITLILQGKETEACDNGFCDKERTIMRMYLAMHGYLEEAEPATTEEAMVFADNGSHYRMTETGRELLEGLVKKKG